MNGSKYPGGYDVTPLKGKFYEGELVKVDIGSQHNIDQIGPVVGYKKYRASNAYFVLVKDKTGKIKVVGFQSHYITSTGKKAKPADYQDYLPELDRPKVAKLKRVDDVLFVEEYDAIWSLCRRLFGDVARYTNESINVDDSFVGYFQIKWSDTPDNSLKYPIISITSKIREQKQRGTVRNIRVFEARLIGDDDEMQDKITNPVKILQQLQKYANVYKTACAFVRKYPKCTDMFWYYNNMSRVKPNIVKVLSDCYEVLKSYAVVPLAHTGPFYDNKSIFITLSEPFKAWYANVYDIENNHIDYYFCLKLEYAKLRLHLPTRVQEQNVRPYNHVKIFTICSVVDLTNALADNKIIQQFRQSLLRIGDEDLYGILGI